jgi:alpha/beta superfamily hydrolase
LEALDLVELIIPLKMSLFCFDFAGCGMSEGDFISLGWHERDDLEIVIDYLRG